MMFSYSLNPFAAKILTLGEAHSLISARKEKATAEVACGEYRSRTGDLLHAMQAL